MLMRVFHEAGEPFGRLLEGFGELALLLVAPGLLQLPRIFACSPDIRPCSSLLNRLRSPANHRRSSPGSDIGFTHTLFVSPPKGAWRV